MASRLHLFGINPIATTLIGVLELDERTILIGVANTAGMDEKTRKAVVQDLKTSLPHPAKLLHGVDPSYLGNAFANHAQPTLHAHLQTSMDAVSTVEQTLRNTNCDRILYTCATAKAYLTVASEIGLSKSDFFKFAELKTLIPERTEEMKTVVGSVHQLLEQHKKNYGQMVTWDGLNRLPYDIQKGLVSEYSIALNLIAHAPKYKLKTINPDLQKKIDDFDDNYTEKFFPRRLPFAI